MLSHQVGNSAYEHGCRTNHECMGAEKRKEVVVAVEADELRASVADAVKQRGFVVEAVDSLAGLGGALTARDPAVIVVGDDLGQRPFRATRTRTDTPIVGLLGCATPAGRSAAEHVDESVNVGTQGTGGNAAQVVSAVEQVLKRNQPVGTSFRTGETNEPGGKHKTAQSDTASAPPADAADRGGSSATDCPRSGAAVSDRTHQTRWTDVTKTATGDVATPPVADATSAETEQTGPFVTSMAGPLESLTGTVIIGASAGGPGVLTSVLSALPAGAGLRVLVVQHLRDVVVRQFAARVDQETALSASVASDDCPVGRDEVVVARGNSHLAVAADHGDQLSVRCVDGPPQNDVKPAVDETMRTAAAVVDEPLVGVLLTGIGVDGAAGLEAIADAGGHTIAQDKETSQIFGMPAAAIETGAVAEVLPGERITNGIVRALVEQG